MYVSVTLLLKVNVVYFTRIKYIHVHVHILYMRTCAMRRYTSGAQIPPSNLFQICLFIYRRVLSATHVTPPPLIFCI